jgi:hypothetical protein
MKKNVFETGRMKITSELEDIIEIFIKCTKLVVSPNIQNIDPFPKIDCISRFIDYFELDEVFLKNNISFFNELKSVEQYIKSTIQKIAGESILKKTTSKTKLSKKRKVQLILLEDIIDISKTRFSNSDQLKNRALKLYTYTINTSMLTPPPSKISKAKFEKMIERAEDNEKEILKNVYNLVGNHYCNQGRITKKNFNELSRIIFNLKHCK